MTEAEYDAAVSEFMRKKGVTRCPTACVVTTHADLGESDRAALRDYNAAREATRLDKLKSYHQPLVA
ncbi:MAG: hypothetical protein ACREFB_08330 [Stellaceae bacterium]